MSAVAARTRIPRGRDRVATACARSGPVGVGGESTLDAVVSGAWEGLAAHQPAPCPVCGAEMRPVYAAHSRPVGGVCQGCGTQLS